MNWFNSKKEETPISEQISKVSLPSPEELYASSHGGDTVKSFIKDVTRTINSAANPGGKRYLAIEYRAWMTPEDKELIKKHFSETLKIVYSDEFAFVVTWHLQSEVYKKATE